MLRILQDGCPGIPDEHLTGDAIDAMGTRVKTERRAALLAGLACALAATIGPAAHGQSASTDAEPTAFWTRHAYFVPAQFDELPGWRDDDLRDAWKAFRQTCSVLGGRAGWGPPCSRAAAVRATSSEDIRRFLEREFVLFQIHNKDRSTNGMITGYYEPLLAGSRRQGDGYVHPVYGVPDNLLYLDARTLPNADIGTPLYARVEGRNVVVECTDPDKRASCTAPYALALGDSKPDIRDKKLRVRVDGRRIVPYFTRMEIERGALADARVLLWVNDLAALYSMQVQGSGKVRLPDGQIVRLAFGEQNGHPFTPPVRAARKRTSPLTRGIAPGAGDDEDDDPLSNDERTQVIGASAPVATRGLGPAQAPMQPDAAALPEPPPPAEEPMSPEVARMVEMLMKGTGSTAQAVLPAAPAKSTAPPQAVAAARPPPRVAAPVEERPTGGYFSPGAPSAYSVDPSYVFFRQIPDSEAGPLGALGVPLTAGRSVAVDPRTTPLGFPVFVAAGGDLNRLMMAQDTGGAIRGPVRADWFWGFGQSAYDRASRMKESGRMWLLMPRTLAAAAGAGGMLTRSLSRGSGGPGGAECVVPDPDFCIE